MKAPIFVRPLTPQEQEALEKGLRSNDAFVLRRCQILLASAKGQKPREIAANLGCASQTVRNVIRRFECQGLFVLRQQSKRPKTVKPILDEDKREQIKSLLHQSPRTLGKNRSTWTLELVAQICVEQGITERQVSIETIREALQRMGVSWQRAKDWISSPDQHYQLKKHQRQRLIELSMQHEDWVLGFLDEVWWSRLAQPSMHAWSDEQPLRLIEKQLSPNDGDSKALSCYGLWCPQGHQMFLRFVQGRPVSDVTCTFLEWVIQKLENQGKKVLALIWDNASWHISQKVRAWIQRHNAQAKRSGGLRIVVCRLPVKSPWLNPIEPKWIHGKRAIVEPERTLSAAELMQRVCDYFGCELLAPISQDVS
jgi:transposase